MFLSREACTSDGFSAVMHNMIPAKFLRWYKLVPIHKWLFFIPPSAGRQIRILILEILQCIPVVKILIFLDLAKTISFLDGHK